MYDYSKYLDAFDYFCLIRTFIFALHPDYEHWYKYYCSEYGSTNIIRWPHPNDCSRFYECHQQQLSAVRCPSYPRQMLYNSTLNNCDLPQRVRCENSPPFGDNFGEYKNRLLNDWFLRDILDCKNDFSSEYCFLENNNSIVLLFNPYLGVEMESYFARSESEWYKKR